MTVKELIKKLQGVKDKNLEVFVEKNLEGKNTAEGVYVLFNPVEKENLPENCVIVES